MAEQNVIKKTVLDDPKLRLSEKVGDNFASLMWSFYKNNPRITVFSGPKGERPISAKMDSKTFGSLLELLDEVIAFVPTDTVKKISFSVDCNRPANKGQSGQVLESRVHIGKNAEGAIYIALQQQGKEVVPFIFKLDTRFHEMRHGSGEKFSIPEMSQRVAKFYSKALAQYLAVVKANDYYDASADANNNNGGNIYIYHHQQ